MSQLDRDTLAALARTDGPARTGDIATQLGCTEREADRRLRTLVQSGQVQGSWIDEPWGEVQWELLPRGRAALDE